MTRLEEIIRARFPRETGMAPAGVTRWGLRWHGRDGSGTRGFTGWERDHSGDAWTEVKASRGQVELDLAVWLAQKPEEDK